MENIKNNPIIIVFFGRSGSGKGTQAQLLMDDFGFEYLSSGDLLRERREKDDFTGNKIKELLGKGQRVPTFLVFKIWLNQIEVKRQENDWKGLIIDGSPRSVLEARLIDQVFKWYEWKNVNIILLDVSREECFNRLSKRRICKNCSRVFPYIGKYIKQEECDKCGGELITRSDDHPEIIKARLDYYDKDVAPIVDYYQKKNKLIKINGEQPIEGVYKDVLKALDLDLK